MIMQGYLNTLKILAMSMVVQLTMTAIGAYFFSRSNVMFKRPLMILITITMFINGGMIPKIKNCVEAVEQGVNRVHILDGRKEHCLCRICGYWKRIWD